MKHCTPQVFWLIKAQDRLEEALGEMKRYSSDGEIMNPEPDKDPKTVHDFLHLAYEDVTRRLEEKLVASMPRARAIIVLDSFSGYRTRKGLFILRVEEIGEDGRPSAKIVKIADVEGWRSARQAGKAKGAAAAKAMRYDDPRARLGREKAGWEACQRRGNQRGRIFMHLNGNGQSHKVRSGRARGYDTLIYEDAQQVLRAAEVVTLEQAVLECCQWGRPPADTLCDVLDQIFAEMTDRFYRRSWTEVPQESSKKYWEKRIEKGKNTWLDENTRACQARNDVQCLLSASEGEWVDPCDYLTELFAKGSSQIPEMQRGCAHGDLHGRNVLVGLVDGRAMFPAVYDYEDMACDNFLGWDFVKLEFELKVRALCRIFPYGDRQFVSAAYDFEKRLEEETEKKNNLPAWPKEESAGAGAVQGKDALLHILLELRRLAKQCLETQRGRNRRWLDEYYYLLTCYGLHAGRFINYQPCELEAAYVCAGVSAYRHGWSHGVREKQEHQARDQALSAIARGELDAKLTFKPVRHYAELEFAKGFARSRKKPFIERAITDLKRLYHKHNYVPGIAEELALAMLELAQMDDLKRKSLHAEVERLCTELKDRFPIRSIEELCRWGRLWKDRGDLALDGITGKQAGDTAKMAYREALIRYKDAWRRYHGAQGIAKSYYPGINAATLHWLLEEDEEARKMAGEILAALEKPQDWGDDLMWIMATRAEACLLLGDIEGARKIYQQAVKQPKYDHHAATAMCSQVRRILRNPRDIKARHKDFESIFAYNGIEAPCPEAAPAGHDGKADGPLKKARSRGNGASPAPGAKSKARPRQARKTIKMKD